MASRKWLRGDPNRPFPLDIEKLNTLVKRCIWPTHEPLWFLRNRGTAGTAEKRQALGYQSPENVALMASLGLHLPHRAHFFKGAGLKHERSSIERTIAYAKELHARGMLVSVYVGGTMFTDYFFKEVPEAINWARKDQAGNPITYGGYQIQRWFPCLNHPDYRAYTKRVLDVAVQEIKADEIFFDNQILRHEPRSCRCENCVRHLREMIRKKYTLEQCEERYGFAEYPDVMPPIWSQACPPWGLDAIRVPHIQDWIDHRIQTVTDFYRDMADHVKKQKPDTAVGMNIKGIHGHNRAFNHGICHGAFSDLLDFSCIDHNAPGLRDGAIMNEVRFYKSSHSTHITVVDGQGSELMAAESQVLNYRKKIEGHGWLGDIGICAFYSPMTQFLRANQRLFHEREHRHDVAVLRAEPSTNYNCAKVHEQLMAFEQTLAIEKIPWGIIFNKQIDELNRYRIIALPEIQAISDRWLDALDAFMKAGGGVIASGKAARFNEWYRPRDVERSLARWLGQPPADKYATAKVGQGCLVYVPTWDVVTKWDLTDWFEIGGTGLLPVKNRKEFLKAIDAAACGRPLTHRVTGNDCVFVEAIDAENGVDLHFINYNPDNCKPKMTVRVALPIGRNNAEVMITNPHQLNPVAKKTKCMTRDGVVVFTMFTPPVYGLTQVQFIAETYRGQAATKRRC
ncbi:MAG: alpha-amylase family protein [Planctomycetota bacterium]